MQSFKWTSAADLEIYRRVAIQYKTNFLGVDYVGNFYRYAAFGARMPGNERASIYVLLSEGKSFIIPEKYVVVDKISNDLEIHYISMYVHTPPTGHPSLRAIMLTPDTNRPALIPYDDKLYNIGDK